MKLVCTQQQFEGIHKDVDGTRPSTEIVKVNRQALVNLLDDHARLIEFYEKEGKDK